MKGRGVFSCSSWHSFLLFGRYTSFYLWDWFIMKTCELYEWLNKKMFFVVFWHFSLKSKIIVHVITICDSLEFLTAIRVYSVSHAILLQCTYISAFFMLLNFNDDIWICNYKYDIWLKIPIRHVDDINLGVLGQEDWMNK